MIKIFVERPEDELYFVDSFFDNKFDKNLIKTDFSKKVILGIDDSEVLGNNIIHSNFLDEDSPRSMLSTGCKSILVTRYTNEHIAMERLRDNCFEYLQLAADVRDKNNEGDILIYTSTLRDLFNIGVREAVVVNANNYYINNFRSWLDPYYKGREYSKNHGILL